MSAGAPGEGLRKALHIAFGFMALGLRYVSPMQALLVLGAALLFNIVLLHRLTHGSLLREDERARGFSWGVILYPVVLLGCVVLFHKRLELAAAVWALLAFGDGMASVCGRLLGGPTLPWNRGKRWTGLIAFVLYGAASAALLVRWTQQAVHDRFRFGGELDSVGLSFLDSTAGGSDAVLLLTGCGVAALGAGFAESLRSRIDDNVRVGVVGAALFYWVT